MTEFVSSADAPAVSQVGPATPDHTIYTKRLPCFVAISTSASDPAVTWTAVEQRRRSASCVTTRPTSTAIAAPGVELLDALPRVVLVPGLGHVHRRSRRAHGRDRRRHLSPHDRRHRPGLRLRPLRLADRPDAFDVEYWPLELYKLTLAPPEKELARRIVLVTGGGSGIGRAVAQRLAAEGAHVAITDVDAESARRVADEVTKAVGGGRALGLPMDVTSEASVREAFEATVLAWGGLDILVSNAGIAHSAPVDRMALADWERSFAVNSTGHFLVAREAMRVLIRQGIGGALVFVATKNVMSPGKDFAAYSAAKAAEAQLAKVLALEGAPARHPLQHREPGRHVPGLQALVGGDPA